MFSRQTILLLVLWTRLLIEPCAVASADEAEKKSEKVQPRIAMCIPLAVPADATTKLIVRGWGLEEAKEIRSSNARLTLKILATGKATIPNKQDAKQIGDTQIELAVTVTKDIQPTEVELIIVQTDKESQSHKLLIGNGQATRGPSLAEKEPNDGFTQAQPLHFPQVVDGQIESDGNVDVFSFELTDKQHIVLEVHASRYGSNLDSILTLFDQRGNIVAVNDDAQVIKGMPETKDSKIFTLLAAGRYFISLQDAHDRGGPAHPYRLTVGLSQIE
jgi:hypothetical protein